MKLLWQDFKGYTAQLILGPLFKLAEAVLELMIPLLMANIIDVGIKNGDVRYIVTHGIAMLGLGALGLCFAMICQYFAAVCAQGFGRSVRKRLFRHVFSLSQAEYGAVGTDSLITRLTNDVNQAQTGVNMFIRLAMRAPFLAIGSVVMAFTISPQIGLIFLIATPLICVVLAVIMRRSVPYYTRIQTQQDRIARLAGESLAGARVIRAFSRQDSEIEQFNAAGDSLAATTVHVGKISAMLSPITVVIVNLAIVLIIWFGGLYADTGVLQQGQIIALVNYMTQTLLALIVLANIVVVFTKAVASAGRIGEVLRLESSMCEPVRSTEEKEGASHIAFENVTFSYPNSGDTALEDISFTVQTGQTLGIIGGTGCGKSTLMHLLLRYYDATDGCVLVNGVNVKDYTLQALRAKIGLVPQTALLFAGTIRSNLQLGAPHATDEQLWAALETAQGADFVRSKPEGLDSLVEEGGKNLSGGQKQRITIARALVKQPQILILDDSASALDYATDAKLRTALRQQAQKMTVILISQRAATLQHATQILVLDEGIAVGLGTHAQLLQTCAIYREICATQGLVPQEVCS